MPFLGAPRDAEVALGALGALELGAGDELVVVDNTPAGVVAGRTAITVLRAAAARSAFHARNAGVVATANQWILFLDADCRPPRDLLATYFEPAPADRVAILAGELAGEPAQTALAARWSRARRGLRTTHHLDAGPFPAAVTGNMLVRREAFEAVGGFDEVRSDADIDLSWRIQAAGWGYEYRPEALVWHRDPERLAAIARQAAGYGAGRRWLGARHPGAAARPQLLGSLARSAGGAAVHALRGRGEQARLKLVDGLAAGAFWYGYVAGDNRPAKTGFDRSGSGR